MSRKTEIFAVIWNDFVPLSLHHASACAAIDSARAMASKAGANGLDVAAMDIRAVHIPADTDSLVVLLSINEESANASR